MPMQPAAPPAPQENAPPEPPADPPTTDPLAALDLIVIDLEDALKGMYFFG